MATRRGIRQGPRPGDLGTVLELHGRIYAAEYGYDEEFEAHVAKGLTGLAERLAQHRYDGGGEPGWVWIAEDEGRAVGCIGLTREEGGVGQIRWFLVDPRARGGLGSRLLDAALEKAREERFGHLRLWTVDGLDAAATLYTRAGFRRTEEVPGHRFGTDLVEVRYDLDLAGA